MIRQVALQALAEANISKKCHLVQSIDQSLPIDTHALLTPHEPLPGIPKHPELVDPKKVPVRAITSPDGHAAMLHAIAHIEFNAINLALDIIWRFPKMPETFYLDWLQVAKEEVYHFKLVTERLEQLGYHYGDFQAHSGLWDMAEKTQNDLLARLALVPRYLEARGLDVNPLIQEKFKSIGDTASIAILEIILRDEIGHVGFGSKWFHYLCEHQQRSAEDCYKELLAQYQLNKPNRQANLVAREQAGFSQNELAWFQDS